MLAQPRINFISRGLGPDIVFIHGFSSSLRVWGHQLDELAGHLHVVALDLRGQGESEKPDQEYPASGFVQDIKYVLDKLGIQKAIIVGHSMGGFVAEEFYYTHPERVRALVLVGTRGLPTLNVEEMNKEVNEIGFKEHLHGRTKRSFVDGTPTEVIERAFQSRLMTPEKIALRIRESYRGYDPSKNVTKINVPTLIIVGEQDRITPVDESRALNRLIPGSKLVIVTGSGHHVMEEKPNFFNKALQEFVQKLG